MCDINKASDNKRNTCAFNKLYVYVSFNPYIYIYKQYCKYELVLTQAECSTWWRETLKYDSKFHTIHAIIRYSNYSTWL